MTDKKRVSIEVTYEENEHMFKVDGINLKSKDSPSLFVIADVVACVLNIYTKEFPCFPDHVESSLNTYMNEED